MNPELVDTINVAEKNELLDLAKRLSGPTRLQKRVNLTELEKLKDDKILVVGKVLGSGDIHRKLSISALGFSEQAKDKLKKAGCDIKTIKQEIQHNKELKGVKII